MQVLRYAVAAFAIWGVMACSAEHGSGGEHEPAQEPSSRASEAEQEANPEPQPSSPASEANQEIEQGGLATGDAALAAWEAWEQALADRSPEALAARYAEDAVLVIGDTPPITGASRIGRYHELLHGGVPDHERDVLAAMAREGEVVVVASVRGTHRGVVMGAPATEASIGRVELARLMVTGDGLINRHEIYADGLSFAGQMSLMEIDHRAPPEASPAPASQVTRHVAPAAMSDDEAAVLKLAEATFEALAARDADRFAGHFHDDGALYDGAAVADAEGRAAIARHVRALWAAFSDLEHRDLELWVAGPFAVATYRLAGTHDGHWSRLGARATGTEVDIPAAMVLKIRDGYIERAWWLHDGLAIAEAIGAHPAD